MGPHILKLYIDGLLLKRLDWLSDTEPMNVLITEISTRQKDTFFHCFFCFLFLVVGIQDLLITFIYFSHILVVLIYHCKLWIGFFVNTTMNINTGNTM